jgi:hypothetical protein
MTLIHVTTIEAKLVLKIDKINVKDLMLKIISIEKGSLILTELDLAEGVRAPQFAGSGFEFLLKKLCTFSVRVSNKTIFSEANL